MEFPAITVRFPATDSSVVCTVRDRWIDFDGSDFPAIKIRDFETYAQAIQREYPGSEIYMCWRGGESLLINPPGMREWTA